LRGYRSSLRGSCRRTTARPQRLPRRSCERRFSASPESGRDRAGEWTSNPFWSVSPVVRGPGFALQYGGGIWRPPRSERWWASAIPEPAAPRESHRLRVTPSVSPPKRKHRMEIMLGQPRFTRYPQGILAPTFKGRDLLSPNAHSEITTGAIVMADNEANIPA
jgi:hypothetical protein